MLEAPPKHAVGARVIVKQRTRQGDVEALAFIEAFIPATLYYKVSLFAPDSQEYTTIPEVRIRPAPVAAFPVGKRVLLVRGEHATAAQVESFDAVQNEYSVTLMADASRVLTVKEAELHATTASSYVVGARVAVMRSGGTTSVAFVNAFDAEKGVYTVCLDSPTGTAKKNVPTDQMRPATSAFAEGARVLVKRSSGEESEAFIEAFDPAIGLYRLALFSPDSGEVKLACEADLREEGMGEGDEFQHLDASVYEAPIAVVGEGPSASADSAAGAPPPPPDCFHATYVQAPVRDEAPVPAWYGTTMKPGTL